MTWKQLLSQIWRGLTSKKPSRLQQKLAQAYHMRHNPTYAEAEAWQLIKEHIQLSQPNLVFYRQSVQYGYILDFYSPKLRIAIEIDGLSHQGREQLDAQRDLHLSGRGIRTLRFRNRDVFENPSFFVQKILTECEK